MNCRNRNILFVILTIALAASVFVGIRLYVSNTILGLELSHSEEKYQELRYRKINDGYSEVREMKQSMIDEEFKWLGSADTDEIILENYDGEKINMYEDASEAVKLVLQGLNESRRIILPDSITTPFLRNDLRFYYILRCKINDTVHEIFIFDDGTIKYMDRYFYSPILLCAAQAIMPVINTEPNKAQPDIIDFILNCSLATSSSCGIADEEPLEEQTLSQLWNNAVRLRASAYFIKNYMVKTDEDFIDAEAFNVMKSQGYRDGQKSEMYIYYSDKGEPISVKLVYNGAEEVYVMDKTAEINSKTLFLPLIWSAG